MKETKELKALLHLLDDPDKEVFETVSDKIIHYGKEVIPKLENLWENTKDGEVQQRIENARSPEGGYRVHQPLHPALPINE